MHSYLLLQEQQKNATVLIRWTSFFHETIGLTAHNRVVSALRDTCHMRSMKIYTLTPVHRIACDIQLSEFLAHEIALRYIHNLHHHRHHHHQNIICFCVAHFIRTFVTFFSSLFSGGILCQTKETAQHFCRWNVDFAQIMPASVVETAMLNVTSPFPYKRTSLSKTPFVPLSHNWKCALFRFVCITLEYAGCVYVRSNVHSVDNYITCTHT